MIGFKWSSSEPFSDDTLHNTDSWSLNLSNNYWVSHWHLEPPARKAFRSAFKHTRIKNVPEKTQQQIRKLRYRRIYSVVVWERSYQLWIEPVDDCSTEIMTRNDAGFQLFIMCFSVSLLLMESAMLLNPTLIFLHTFPIFFKPKPPCMNSKSQRRSQKCFWRQKHDKITSEHRKTALDTFGSQVEKCPQVFLFCQTAGEEHWTNYNV